MRKTAQALLDIDAIQADLVRHSANPYHHSKAEKHVREIFADLAGRLAEALAALKGRKK